MLNEAFEIDCKEWLFEAFNDLTTDLVMLGPSEWAESKRYLPLQLTPEPGLYSFDMMPYLREALDGLDPYSPIEQVDVMKGVQI